MRELKTASTTNIRREIQAPRGKASGLSNYTYSFFLYFFEKKRKCILRVTAPSLRADECACFALAL